MVSILQSFTPTRHAGNLPGMGMYPPKSHRYGWNFLYSHHTIIPYHHPDFERGRWKHINHIIKKHFHDRGFGLLGGRGDHVERNLGWKMVSILRSFTPTHNSALCPEWGCFHRNIIDMPGFFYRLIKQWLCNHHPDFERGRWKWINHIIKITFPPWRIWLVGS